MRLQSNQSSCGAAALYNAGCALGKTLSLEDCERACKTTAEGTSAKQLTTGAVRLGLKADGSFKERSSLMARLWLRDTLQRGAVVIAAVDADEHWVAVVGALGGRYLVADSAENELVLSYSEGEFLQRWQHPESRRGFYALVLC